MTVNPDSLACADVRAQLTALKGIGQTRFYFGPLLPLLPLLALESMNWSRLTN
jgi:hypothetical protein